MNKPELIEWLQAKVKEADWGAGTLPDQWVWKTGWRGTLAESPLGTVSSEEVYSVATELSSEDAVWNEGRLAYHSDQSRESNPHEDDSLDFERWLDGWEDGKEDDEQQQ